jgi:hypothetical protein
MHPRWRSDHSGTSLAPKLPGKRSPCSSRQEFFSEPLPDLAQQLAAELGGASWAVVAFAPEDAPWCDWIYRNLNGYAVPASLVDRVTPDGFPRPDCLSIFPDRRDPAYEEHLPQALEESTYLIVVCSPASAQAETVDEQIRASKKAGGEERILALVVDEPPDAQLGAHPRAAQCDWLPSWLCWRLEENGFRAAERSDPRVIDARRGYRSLQQVRDGLLTALVDVEAAELERLGGFARDVELVSLPAPPPVPKEPVMTIAPATASSAAAPRRSSKFTICTAVILMVVAIVFGTRSFREITADEPVSTLNVGPVTGVLAGHSEKPAPPEEVSSTPETVSAASDAPPAPAATPNTPSAGNPVPTGQAPAVVAPSDAPQVAPAFISAGSKIPPADAQPAPGIVGASAFAPFNAPPPGTAYTAAVAAATSAESDAVLLDEVRTLERRGDEIMAEKRTEDALDLYHTALISAEEYAGRKGANPNARDLVVKLLKKLGTLELQNSSTAEARATYLHLRRDLLQYKSQGQWSHERAKTLDEIESRLLSLPRD